MDTQGEEIGAMLKALNATSAFKDAEYHALEQLKEQLKSLEVFNKLMEELVFKVQEFTNRRTINIENLSQYDAQT